MSGVEWLRWVASMPPEARDRAVEARLGMALPASSAPPGDELIGHHASGVASIVRLLLEVPLDARDVFVDLGSGVGKVCAIVAQLTDARVRGIELQPALVARARSCLAQLNVIELVEGDARTADLRDGTVFFLYLPFTGGALAEVLERLREVASDHAIVVATLGLDLDHVPFLRRRAVDAFWLAIYDSVVSSVPSRRVVESRLPHEAQVIAAVT